MTHRYHPDPDRKMERGWPSSDSQGKGDPPGAILFDDCADCDKYRLGEYDNGTLEALWKRMVEVEKADATHYLTLTEKAVCVRLYEFAVVLERFGANPWTTLQDLAGS